MNLSKRERYVAVVALAAIALLVADRAIVTPLLESGAALATERRQLVQELESASRLFQRRNQLARKWEELTAEGLTPSAAGAESQILHAIRNWASEAGLALSSVKPDRSDKDGRLRRISVLVSGTGTMRAAARFLWQMETTDLPLRIHELQIGSRKEGTDDLSLQVKVSTLYLGASPAAAAQGGPSPVGGTS